MSLASFFYDEIDTTIHQEFILYFDFYFNILVSFSFVGLQDDDHDLDSILENMAIKLTAEELNDVPVASDASDVPVDGE